MSRVVLVVDDDPAFRDLARRILAVFGLEVAAEAGTAAAALAMAGALRPDAMLVDYDGAWDDGYFERLAQRVDTLDDRPSLAEQGGRLREPAERFAYPRLVLSLSTVFTGA